MCNWIVFTAHARTAAVMNFIHALSLIVLQQVTSYSCRSIADVSAEDSADTDLRTYIPSNKKGLEDLLLPLLDSSNLDEEHREPEAFHHKEEASWNGKKSKDLKKNIKKLELKSQHKSKGKNNRRVAIILAAHIPDDVQEDIVDKHKAKSLNSYVEALTSQVESNEDDDLNEEDTGEMSEDENKEGESQSNDLTSADVQLDNSEKSESQSEGEASEPEITSEVESQNSLDNDNLESSKAILSDDKSENLDQISVVNENDSVVLPKTGNAELSLRLVDITPEDKTEALNDGITKEEADADSSHKDEIGESDDILIKADRRENNEVTNENAVSDQELRGNEAVVDIFDRISDSDGSKEIDEVRIHDIDLTNGDYKCDRVMKTKTVDGHHVGTHKSYNLSFLFNR